MAIPAVLAGLAATAASTGINYMLSEKHADNAMERQKKLLSLQNSYNQAAQVNALGNQVQGARLAGLNPAMFSGQMSAAQSVGLGSAPKAENVEVSPADILTMAQAKNLEAQTEKTEAETSKIEGVDTANVEADTQAKKAASLLTQAQTVTEGGRPGLVSAQTANTEAEAQRIKNLNKAFAEEDAGIGLFGQSMALQWQKESWYKNLPKGSKMIIDDIARGDLDLTVGIANALDRSISSDSRMNAAHADKVNYALTRAVVERQMKNPKVLNALVKTPEAQYNEVIARATKLGAETKMLNFDYGWKNEQKEVWQKNDPDKLYAEYQKNPTIENAAKWLVGSIRSTGADVVKSTVPAAVGSSIGGRVLGKSLGKSYGEETRINKAGSDYSRSKAGSDYSRSQPPVHTPFYGVSVQRSNPYGLYPFPWTNR